MPPTEPAISAPQDQALLASAKRVIDIELEGGRGLYQALNADFIKACRLIQQCRGRVVVIGMGKSGHIGGKIAATLASTGTAAFFVHPGEASHGDLGMIQKEDVVIAISYSGETAELLTLVPALRRHRIVVIAITGAVNSRLAQYADAHLCVHVAQEACPLGLAPTASTTATLMMGDALAVALLEQRGFTREDFALSHPGGSLGRRLLLRIGDMMQTQNLPLVAADTTLRESVLAMTSGGLGMAIVVDATGQFLGVFTDGDLRRTLDIAEFNFDTQTVERHMTRAAACAQPDTLAAEVLLHMQQREISAMPVVDTQQHPIGAVHVHQLLAAGL